MRKINIPKEILIEKYLIEGKSTVQIADELNICDRTVANRLREHGIEVRYSNSRKGKNNPNFGNIKKGAGYNAIHDWINKHKGKKGVCKECGKKGRTVWSSNTHEYTRDLNEYVERCYSCHNIYDQIGVGKKHSKQTKKKMSKAASKRKRNSLGQFISKNSRGGVAK